MDLSTVALWDWRNMCWNLAFNQEPLTFVAALLWGGEHKRVSRTDLPAAATSHLAQDVNDGENQGYGDLPGT